MYEPRFYRQYIKTEDLAVFEVQEKQTDLLICADSDFSKEALASVIAYRAQIEEFISKFPVFLTSYSPVDIPSDAVEIIQVMAHAAALAEVGPMAAIAGAISEFVGRELLQYSNEVIVENGGDIFIKTDKQKKVGLYAGDSALSNKLAIVVKPDQTPIGICTSSGTVGHSKSFGKADAVVILAGSCALADAVATRVGNMVRTKDDIQAALDYSKGVNGVLGAIIIIGDGLGCWGSFEFTPL